MERPRPHPAVSGTPNAERRTPFLGRPWRQASWGVCLFTIALAGFLATMPPASWTGDAGEFAVAGCTWGVAHPPGYPLYTIVANAWCHALPFGEPAWRLNVLSAIFAAGAVLLVFVTAQAAGLSTVGSAFGAMTVAAGRSFWSQAVVSEVYALEALLVAALILATVKTVLAGPGALGRRWAVASAVVFGLVVGHRLVDVLFAPLPLLAMWRAAGPSWSARGRLAVQMAVGTLATFVVLAYLPIASARNPMLDTGDPQTWSRFWEVVTAKVYRQYLEGAGTHEEFWARGARLVAMLPAQAGLALLLAPVALGVWWRGRGWRRGLHHRSPAAEASDATNALTFSAALVTVVNVVFCAAYKIPDIETYLLPATVGLGLLGAIGADAIWRRRWSSERAGKTASGPTLHRDAPGSHGGRLARLAANPGGRLMLAITIAVACAALGAWNWRFNDLRGQDLVVAWGREALDVVEPGAIVLDDVDTQSNALRYVHIVEGRRPDVLLVTKGRAVTWYQDQIRARRPDLALPRYDGPGSGDVWPAMIVEQWAGRKAVYATAPILGYFGPSVGMKLASEFVTVPAGPLFRILPRNHLVDLGSAAARSEESLRRLWPSVERAMELEGHEDLTALALNVAACRILAAEVGLSRGATAAARKVASDIARLPVSDAIARLNEAYGRSGRRYHMTDMVERADRLARLANAIEQGETGARIEAEGLPGTLLTRPLGAAPASSPVVPPDAVRRNETAVGLARAGRLKEALAALDLLIRDHPGYADAHFNRGKVLELMGRTREAIAGYERTLSILPDHLLAHEALGRLLSKSDPHRAAGHLRRVVEAAPPGARRDAAAALLRDLAKR